MTSTEKATAPSGGHPALVTRLAELHARAERLAAGPERRLLGVTGPPGAGKTTLARTIVDGLGDRARRVGMDGFHLSQDILRRLNRLSRKGSIDTFDAAGFVALVQRLRDDDATTIYAPVFRRDLEESIACGLQIEPEVRLLVVEGNYLLVGDGPWGRLRELLDEVWYCAPDEEARLSRLITRHRNYGKSEEAARRWALGPDERNAQLIAATSSRADVIARVDL